MRLPRLFLLVCLLLSRTPFRPSVCLSVAVPLLLLSAFKHSASLEQQLLALSSQCLLVLTQRSEREREDDGPTVGLCVCVFMGIRGRERKD